MKYKWLILLLAVFVAVGVGVLVLTQPDRVKKALNQGVGKLQETRYDMPARGICARHGTPLTHPDDTLVSFRRAVEVGAHMIKFVAQPCEDGEMIVMRDPEVDRTTNGKGRVQDLTLAEIKALDAGTWKNKEFAGTQVPTLREVLRAMPKDIWIVVDMRHGRAVGREVARIVVAERRQHQVILACSSEAIAGAREVDPSLHICNMQGQANSQKYIDATIAAKADFIQLHGPPDDTFKTWLDAAKKAGLKVIYFGTDLPDEAKKVLEMGADFVVTHNAQVLVDAAVDAGVPRLVPRN